MNTPQVKETGRLRTLRWKRIAISSLFIIPFFILFKFGAVLILSVIAISLLRPSGQNRFLKYNNKLPTSSVGSLKSGIVKLEGIVTGQTLLRAPLSNKPCIGYEYTAYEERRNYDNESHFCQIHQEQRCNEFTLQDATGKVTVEGEGLDLQWLRASKKKRAGDEIKCEYRLEPGERCVLIGLAVRQNERVYITRDSKRRIFGIAPVSNLIRREHLEVMLGRAGYYLVGMALAVSLMLLVPLEVTHHQLTLDFGQLPERLNALWMLPYIPTEGFRCAIKSMDLTFMSQESGYAVLLAAVGPLVAILFFGTTLRVPLLKSLSAAFAGVFALAWFPGIAMSVVMMLCEINGVKILLCWVIVLISVAIFVVANFGPLARLVTQYNQND